MRELKFSDTFAAKLQEISRRRGWTKEQHEEVVEVITTAVKAAMRHGGEVATDEAVKLLKAEYARLKGAE